MEFYDLNKQYLTIKKRFLTRLAHIQEESEYILGSDVKRFEEDFARYCGVQFAVGVNSGTDALFLSLKSLDVKAGDEVIVPTFTFIATSFAVTMTGATPIFVDIDEKTFTIDVGRIQEHITKKTRAVIPVHLFGLCANMKDIALLARKNNLYLIEDAAQAHGARIGDKKAGSFGSCGCFSFYPTKNLSAFGDGGLITTNSKKLYRILSALRDCGRSTKRYLHHRLGYNSRLDNVQAACLRLKLKKLDTWNKIRIRNAKLYACHLKGLHNIILPTIPDGHTHVFHAYSILTKKRSALINEFKNYKIPYSIFYQVPLHLQKANANLGYHRGNFPISERVAQEIISLPIHPALSEKEISKVAEVIKKVHHD